MKGQKLASPEQVVANAVNPTRLTVAWDGGSTRDIDVITGTGHWYRIGEDLVEIRWGHVHDCTGTHRDEYCLTTDMTMRPEQLVACDTPRWSIATTFQEGREYLPLESTKGDGQHTVWRCTPGLFGLYLMVVRLYRQLPRPARTLSSVLWRGKSTVTFSDMMTCVRRALWAQWGLHTQADAQEFSKLSPSLQEIILYALAPAA